MRMRKIWRLESADGVGIYRSAIAGNVLGNTFSSDRHPMPGDDAMLQDIWWCLEQPAWYFGFASLAQYRAWFFKKAHRRAFGVQGAILRLYIVPDWAYHRGMNQAIFIKANAALLKERSPDI